jgi:hypothetical protein
MSLGDVGGILRGLMSQVSFVRLTAQEEARVRELVKELQQILDSASKKTA